MILSVEKLSHSYGVRTLFKDVTFNIEMGDKIGIIGGGQLGKMMILDAKRLDDYFVILDPTLAAA